VICGCTLLIWAYGVKLQEGIRFRFASFGFIIGIMSDQVVDQKKCVTCGADFSVFERDRKFYEKFGKSMSSVLDKDVNIPDPSECWDCRQIRRQAQRNERFLYRGKCGKCQKDMLTIYSPDKRYDVFCSDCWWADGWDPMDYGRDFDFSRPFFDQWKEFYDVVPKLGLIVLGVMENSEYAHDAYRLKNCYLIFDGEQGYDCLYGETFLKIKDCMDFLVTYDCELCYETVNCSNCYNVRFCRFCRTCSESSFLVDCVGCKNCFACVNQHQKQYCIFNKQYSKEEYEEKVHEFDVGSYKELEEFKVKFEEFVVAQPKRAFRGVKNEDVSGDCLDNCKDTYYSFDCVGSRDCSYCTNLEMGANDCFDVDIWGDNLNLALNCDCVGAGAQNLMCDYYVGMNVANIFYSNFCMNGGSDFFGCIGLRHKRFCVFNKQYSESEYKKLVGRIIDHMIETGEWGHFFPVWTSAFDYNETMVSEFYPLSKEDVLAKGYGWKDKEDRKYLEQKYVVPDRIEDVSDEICDEVLACGGSSGDGCGKNFKIVLPELKYYRKHGLPVSRKCPDCRHLVRRRSKNPRKLWERECSRSGEKILTPYAPNRPEEVLSEEAYVKEFF
jgi:hypothetical protein